MPEKIFAHSFVEVSCGPTSFCVDAAGALHQWALSAIGSLEKRYAGDANAWSSWCEGYRDRLWPETIAKLQLREEWDWTFRCDCKFEMRRAGSGGWWQQHGSLVSHGIANAERVLEQHGEWVSDDFAPICLFAEVGLFKEQRVKIYEDFLSDLGISSLICRCRHDPKGFELRLSWFASVNPEHEPKRGIPHCQMRYTILCYNAPSEILWKTASEPAPFLFLEGDFLELTAAKRLDIDAMNAGVHLAAQRGHSRMPSVLRHRFVQDVTSHQLSLPNEISPRHTPATILVFQSIRNIVDIVCDPDDDNRIAIVSADGAIVVVENLSVVWRSECKNEDTFRLVEAIIWCGPCLLSSGGGGELRFFRPGLQNSKETCASLSIYGPASVGADSYLEGKSCVQNVAACLRLVVCSAGKAVSLVHIKVRGRKSLRLGRLFTLLPLSSTVVALSLIPELLVVATLGRGCVLWKEPELLEAAAPPDALLSCGGPCVTTYVLDQTVVAPCRDSTVRVWKQDCDACKNVSGLRCRAPECCIVRSASNPDSIILVVADGDDGLLLWPLSSSNSPSVVSRRARRLPNQNSSINATGLAGVAANLFVIYNDGSLNTFILHTGSNGLSATLTHVYGTDRHWQTANISYTVNKRCLTVYAAYGPGPTTKLAIYSPFEIHTEKFNEWCKNRYDDGLPKIYM